MNRIDARFAALKQSGKAAFIPFFTAGDPDLETTKRLMIGAEDAGADVIELGVPFSDPIADGPTIQASYTRVLEHHQRLAAVFDLVSAARQGGCELPVVAMVSYSIVFRIGFDEFLRRAIEADIDGATVPDLPVEEATAHFAAAAERDFRLICFVTPATTEARRALVIRHARGFVYYISVRGITGERSELPPDLTDNIALLKASTSTPIAVGFGVATPEQSAAVARTANGVIVGSAIVNCMAQAAQQGTDAAQAALDFISRMNGAAKSIS